MKKYLLILPLLLLSIGCGKKNEVVCTVENEEDGVTTEIIATLDNKDKVQDAKIKMTFNDEKLAEKMCSTFELTNSYAEKEEDKLEFKCSGKSIEMSANDLVGSIDVTDITKSELIDSAKKEDYTCK